MAIVIVTSALTPTLLLSKMLLQVISKHSTEGFPLVTCWTGAGFVNETYDLLRPLRP